MGAQAGPELGFAATGSGAVILDLFLQKAKRQGALAQQSLVEVPHVKARVERGSGAQFGNLELADL